MSLIIQSNTCNLPLWLSSFNYFGTKSPQPWFGWKLKKTFVFAEFCFSFLAFSCFFFLFLPFSSFFFLFQHFCVKNVEKVYFDQRLECEAPKHWSKYATGILLFYYMAWFWIKQEALETQRVSSPFANAETRGSYKMR